MKEIVIISGKGGTGKTSMVASLAVLAKNAVLADCDVDAADLHLVLKPTIKKKAPFTGGKRASILTEKCSSCGKCYELCRFDAVLKTDNQYPVYSIDPISCEGCSVCHYFCPEKAIEFKSVLNGSWFISNTQYGPMVHAKLGTAEENSGRLVSIVREKAKEIAQRDNHPYIIVDGPPGIGCPVIASVTGADAVLIVTEPTVSGKHDLERVAKLTGHFKIPTFLCINKFDINLEMSKSIEKNACAMGITNVGKIHYDRAVTQAQIQGLPVITLAETKVATDIKKVWHNMVNKINKDRIGE